MMKRITFLFISLLMSAVSWQGTAQTGSTCDDPIVVTTMPFTETGNTSNYGNNYSSSDMPPLAPGAIVNGSSSSYLGGDDVVYSYTAGANGFINVNASGVDSWVGMYVFTGCPFASTVGAHTSSSSGTRSIPNLPVIAGETYYIVISTWPTPNSTAYTLTLDGTDVADPPTCPKPISLVATTVATTSADIGWTAGGTETSWNVSWGTLGYTTGGAGELGTAVVSAASYQITGLNPNSSYEFYVQADCSGGDLSFWSGPRAFRTACDIISSLPYTEDFDTYGTGSDAFPACWERPVTYTSGTIWPSIVSRTDSPSLPNSLRFQSDVGIPTYAVSPPFAENIENLRVSFMLRREGTSSGTIDIGVMSDANDITTFELVQTIDPANAVWLEYTFDLNQISLSGSGNFIAFRQNSTSNNWYYWLDDFEVKTIPTCLEPTALSVDAITETTADASWTAGDSETSWNISWGTSGYTPGDADEVGDATATVASYQITGLNSNTAYDVYVQGDCGLGDLSYWAGPFTFRTACDVVSNLPYTENFDTYGTGSDAFPACWERPVTYISGTTWPSIVTRSDSPSSPNSLKFQSAVGTPTYAVSPPFAEDIENLRVTFMLRREGASSGTMDVGVMSDANDITTFELVQTIDPANAVWIEYTFDLHQVSLSGPDNFIALRQNSTSNIWYYWLDDFEVDLIPSCVEPTALAVDATATTTADVSWTEGFSETAWNVSWGLPGYTPEIDEIGAVATSVTSYQITGLDPSTTYEVRVQADCGPGDLSYWTDPVSFTTTCVPVVAPWSEDFENGGVIPNCWEQGANNGKPWKFSNTGAGNHIGNNGVITGSTPSGGYFAWVDDSSPEFANTTLLSPPIDVSALTNPELTFYLLSNNEGNSNVDLSVDVYDGAAWNNGVFTNNSNTANGGWEEITVNLSTLNITGNIQIRFVVDDMNNDFYDDVAIDDISVHEQPDCPKPTELSVAAATPTTADITWVVNGTETAWNISWGPVGYTPGDTSELGNESITAYPYQITGLTADTNYSVYVQADCVGDESPWAGPLSLFTGYCIPSSTSTSDYLSEVSSNGAVTDMSYTATSMPTGGYSDQTLLDFESYETQTFDIITNYVGGTNGVNIWVDWNNNMEFEASELMGYQAGSGEKTFAITVPAGMAQGDYRMRVRGQYGSTANPAPCGSVTYGSTIDFTLTLVTPPTCLAPMALEATGVAANTANITWTPSGAETAWNVSWGSPGYTPGDANEIGTAIATAASYQITGLNPSTDYDVYVQADCGAGDVSFWTGALSITTTCVAVVAPWTEGFENGGVIPNCWEQGANNGKPWKFSNTGAGNHIGNNGVITGSTQSGGYFAWVDDSSPEFANTTLITPIIDVSALTNPELTFYLLSNNEGQSNVDFSVDVYDGAAWNNDVFTNNSNTANGAWEEITVNLSTLNITGDIQIRFVVDDVNNNFYDDVAIDDVSVHEQPTCPKPTNLLVDNITDNSADFSWTENGTATEWEIVYGLTGFDPAIEGMTQTVNTTPETTLNGLTPSSFYDVYVKAICAVGEESFLSTPVTFMTSCVPASIPFTEGFETGYAHDQALGGCWSQASITGTNPWTVNNTFTTYNRTPNTGGWNVTLRYGNEDWMFYPLDLTAGTSYMLTFYARQDGTNSANASIQASYGTADNPAAMTNTIVASTPLINGNYQEFQEFFTPATSGVYYLGIKGQINSTPWYISLDDISVEEASGCLRPGALAVGSVTDTTADVSWNENGTATEWDVIYGLAGFNPTTEGTTVNVTTTPETTLTGLTTDTGYEFYVRAICGAGDESTLSAVKYFFTGYCQYSSTSTSYYINNFETTEAIQNISNTNSGLSPNGYGNFTNMVVTTFAGGEFDFAASYAGTSTYGFNMWIDYNGNMEFEPSEKVYSSGYSSGAQGTITVPMGTANGNYRIRIVADWLNSNPEPCGTSSYGEAEDYTLMIIDAPSCMPPRGVAVVGTTETTADVSWTPWGTETEWDIKYGAPGFDPETEGTIQNHTGGVPEATITGLTASTEYQFYVRGVCGVDDVSIWTGPGYFVTECIVLNLPYSLDFETATPPNLPICTSVQTIGNGNDWKTSYINQNGFTGRGLRYTWNSQNAANSWFYTQGLNLIAGVEYEISYKYGNADGAFSEKMKVAYGTSPGSTYMTNELADYTDITGGQPTEESIVFTAPEDGVYYFGFNVYSPAAQFYLFLDDIYIGYAAECDPVTGVEVEEITDTSVTVSWTASPTATEGYTVDVFLQGADPSIDTPEASASVAIGETSATVTGLVAETAYDVYVTSDCGQGNIVRSQAISFVTTDLGVGRNDFAQINYFPNPVKEQLTITAAKSIESVTVYNLLGQAVMQVKPRDIKVVLDMATLPTGTYVLKATVADAASTFKIVKE